MNNAFLSGDLVEGIDNPHKATNLTKPCMALEKLQDVEVGFKNLKSDISHVEGLVIVLVYIDDNLIIGNERAL